MTSNYPEFVLQNIKEYSSGIFTEAILNKDIEYKFTDNIINDCQYLLDKVNTKIRLIQLERYIFTKCGIKNTKDISKFCNINFDKIHPWTHINILLEHIFFKTQIHNTDWCFKTLSYLYSHSNEYPKENWEIVGGKVEKVKKLDVISKATKLIEGDKKYLPEEIRYYVYLNHLKLWQINILIDTHTFKRNILQNDISEKIISFCKHYPDPKTCLYIFYVASDFRNFPEFEL